MKYWEIVGFFALSAVACEPDHETVTSALEVTVAPIANDGCSADIPSATLPERLDALVFRVQDSMNRRVAEQRLLPAETSFENRHVLLEQIPVGTDLRLSLYVCVGGEVNLYGRSAPVDISEDRKTPVSIRLRPVDKLSCTGNPSSVENTPYSAMERARVFPTVTGLPDGTVFISGGADNLEQGDQGVLMTVGALAHDYDVYNPIDTLFQPSIDRSAPEVGGRLKEGRIGGSSFAYQASDGRTGLFVFGGAKSVAFLPTTMGPLVPTGGGLPAVYAEFLEFRSESSTPVEVDPLALGLALTTRFAFATAQDASTGTIVIAGGLEYPGGVPTPSPLVEVINAGVLKVLILDRPRVGATLTPLGADRFLLWGGDLDDCGASPAVIIEPFGLTPLRTLPYQAVEPPPVCAAPAANRTWWPTAFHAATSLGVGLDGTARVLITGGLELRDSAIGQSPDIGGPLAAPNVIIVSLPMTNDMIRIDPVSVSPEVAPRLKRALHAATLVGSRVIVGGGWVRLNETIIGVSGANDFVFLDFPALGPPVVSLAPFISSIGRLGHAQITTLDGTVLIAGGMTRREPALYPAAGGELYQPPLPDNPCVGTDAPPVLGLPEVGVFPMEAGVPGSMPDVPAFPTAPPA